MDAEIDITFTPVVVEKGRIMIQWNTPVCAGDIQNPQSPLQHWPQT